MLLLKLPTIGIMNYFNLQKKANDQDIIINQLTLEKSIKDEVTEGLQNDKRVLTFEVTTN